MIHIYLHFTMTLTTVISPGIRARGTEAWERFLWTSTRFLTEWHRGTGGRWVTVFLGFDSQDVPLVCWAAYGTRGDRSLFVFSFHPPQRWSYNHTILWSNWDNSIHRLCPQFWPVFQTLLLVDLFQLENLCYWAYVFPHPFAQVMQILSTQNKARGRQKAKEWTV